MSELSPVAEAVEPAALQEIGAWLGQLVRAIKTCRLYDEANPTVVRAREELAASLAALLARCGAVQLAVGTHTLAYAGHDLQTGRSGDDNIAAVLHRDGIRALGFEPGIPAREVEALLERLLAVTGPAAGDDDLVTLLWDANLSSVTIETVPLEGEADGSGEEDEEQAARAAWPKQGTGPAEAPAPESPASARADGSPAPPVGAASVHGASRSDDWTTGEGFTEIEDEYDELETVALFEIARFQRECDQGRSVNESGHALRILEDCLASALEPADRAELAAFIPRVLRETLGVGDWKATIIALTLIQRCEPNWPVEEFCRELCGALGITTRRVVAALDRQDAGGVASFLELARQLGPPAVEWLMHVIAGSEQMNVRRPLARRIAELATENPDVILPWLSDGRWYVVRNAVHILGWIGGEALAGYLQSPAAHPEMRVRREVVAALSEVSSDRARPILMSMLKAAEPPLFVTLLQRLALDPHLSIQDGLLELLRNELFARRSDAERRALFSALATRGDGVLPALEAELTGGGWFSHRPESDLTAIALCLSRIGTPAARAILERGLRSGRKGVRKACAIAGASREARDE